MELDTKSISILNKPPKTVIFRCLLTINHERQKPLFCPKTLARQALELQVFRPESLRRIAMLILFFLVPPCQQQQQSQFYLAAAIACVGFLVVFAFLQT